MYTPMQLQILANNENRRELAVIPFKYTINTALQSKSAILFSFFKIIAGRNKPNSPNLVSNRIEGDKKGNWNFLEILIRQL